MDVMNDAIVWTNIATRGGAPHPPIPGAGLEEGRGNNGGGDAHKDEERDGLSGEEGEGATSGLGAHKNRDERIERRGVARAAQLAAEVEAQRVAMPHLIQRERRATATAAIGDENGTDAAGSRERRERRSVDRLIERLG